MTDRNAATGLRLLAPRARAVGAGDGDAVQNINTSKLPDGAIVYSENAQTYYQFRRAGGLTPGGGPFVVGDIITPVAGPGQWIPLLGFLAARFSYAIYAVDEVAFTAPAVWTAFPGTATWSDLDGTVLDAPSVDDQTAFWSTATPGAGLLTYHGPGRRFLVHGDISHTSFEATDVLLSAYISKNGQFLGTASVLVREQRQFHPALEGTPAVHVHCESRLIMNAGDTIQLAIIDRGTPSDLTVVSAALAVVPIE